MFEKRSRRLKRARRWLVYALARGLVALLLCLPLGWVLALGRAFGRFAFRIARRERQRAVAQLTEMLRLQPLEAQQLARQSFESMGMIAAEVAWLPRLRPRLADYVRLATESEALLNQALAEGKGALFITGHVGNWELLAQRIVAGRGGATVARSAPNPYLGAWIVQRRAVGGLQTIERGDISAARRMLEVFKRGALLGVLIDQDTKVPSVHVPFFGRPAATPRGATELALRKQIPVLVGFVRREAWGHRLTVERIDLQPYLDLPREDAVVALTAQLTLKIEAAIRASPAEWVWVHERWKTPPTSAAGSAA